jgi:hypothetical protein
MLIRIRPDARPTRRAYQLGAGLIGVTLVLWTLQQTAFAPLPHDRDASLLGAAAGVAFGLCIFWLMNRGNERED